LRARHVLGVEGDADGEWVPKERKYYAFDLPDQPGDYDHRCKVLCELASPKIPGLIILDRYEAHFPEVYAALPRETTEGVVFKRRSSFYAKQRRASAETRAWLKRRFAWD
jgi:ATP-dependent DNA ligase